MDLSKKKISLIFLLIFSFTGCTDKSSGGIPVVYQTYDTDCISDLHPANYSRDAIEDIWYEHHGDTLLLERFKMDTVHTLSTTGPETINFIPKEYEIEVPVAHFTAKYNGRYEFWYIDVIWKYLDNRTILEEIRPVEVYGELVYLEKKQITEVKRSFKFDGCHWDEYSTDWTAKDLRAPLDTLTWFSKSDLIILVED